MDRGRPATELLSTMRRGGLRRISQSCRSCYGNPERSLFGSLRRLRAFNENGRTVDPAQERAVGTYRELQPERGRNGMRRLQGNPTAEYKDRPSDKHKGRAWALADRTRRAARRLPIPLRRRTCCRY